MSAADFQSRLHDESFGRLGRDATYRQMGHNFTVAKGQSCPDGTPPTAAVRVIGPRSDQSRVSQGQQTQTNRWKLSPKPLEAAGLVPTTGSEIVIGSETYKINSAVAVFAGDKVLAWQITTGGPLT